MSEVRTIPWLTEGAIRFLDGYLCANMQVLEFGIGGSTIWMAPRCNLITVEHEHKWIAQIKPQIDAISGLHWQCYFRPRPYHEVCFTLSQNRFDLVLLDGRDRMLCLEAALPLIKPGGYLMLDNAEREHYVRIYRPFLATWNETINIQRQPDSLGFVYQGWTTSWWQKPV